MAMNFIGLDLSLTSTGLALPDGTVKTISTKHKGVERLDHIQQVVIDELAPVQGPGVIIEGYAFSTRNSQSHSIGELGGVVKWMLWRNGIPFVIVPPTCRAKFATGKGNAAKAAVVSAISARTGIVWEGAGADDQCDAWILREMALAYFSLSAYEWPKVNLSALETVDWSPFE